MSLIMKRKAVHTGIIILLTFSQFSCSLIRGQGIQEIKSRRPSYVAAPNDALQTLRELMTYISKLEPDIFHDESGQKKFLTEHLRKGVANYWNAYQQHIKEHETCGLPNNGIFVGAWEYPSDYKILDDRRYDKRVIIDVQYEWNDFDANYGGSTRLVSFVFMLEEDTWKLEDIYSYNSKDATPYSLSEILWREKYE
jgi:hypothetical protein